MEAYHDDGVCGVQLRRYFATLMISFTGCPAADIWQHCQDILIQDLLLQENTSIERATDKALNEIGTMLRHHNCSDKDKGLPPASGRPTELDLARQELETFCANDDNMAAVKRKVESLNSEQRLAFDQIVESALFNQGKIFNLTSLAGCGKSYLMSCCIEYLQQFQLQQELQRLR